MTKAQIHFSNDLARLATSLKEGLYPEGSSPFEKRLVVVPHLGMKSYLMQSLARDEVFRVAAGLQVVNLSQGYAKLAKAPLPSGLELSLFLQHELLPMIDREHELSSYFGSGAREKRIGPFCDALASHFLRYGVFGHNPLHGWRAELWSKAKQRWRFPTEAGSLRGSAWRVHLFGFSFLPASYFSFFQKQGAQFYLFSPCRVYWGDYVSEREKKEQLTLFDEGQNPLLASLGKVGRKMHVFVEDTDGSSTEHYRLPEGDSALRSLQLAILDGVEEKVGADESLEFFQASTRLREVELLYDRLALLFEKGEVAPRDVAVFAPDISKYAPFIEASFSGVAFSISDLKASDVDPLARAFAKLLMVLKERFSYASLLQFFAAPPVLEKFGLDLSLFKKWARAAHIKWGFSKGQREQFYLQEGDASFLARNPEEGTVSWGLKRLILGLGHVEGEGAPLPIVEMTEVEELDRWMRLIDSLASDFEPLLDGTRWTISTWLRYFACMMESYFAFDPTHDLYKQLLQLASASDPLDSETVPFAGVERILTQLLGRKGKTLQAPHLQAVRFASLAEGCALPAKVVCLLGMEEESFPGGEEESSLYVGEVDFRPKRADQMRMAVLELLLSAQDKVILSCLDDSPLIGELISQIEGAELVCEVGTPVPRAEPLAPLIPSFYADTEIEKPSVQPKEIDIQKLFKFARHPLRFYFHEILGIRPEWGRGEDSEFLLNPLTKHKLVREAFKKPVDEVFREAMMRGELPQNLLTRLAREQVEQELSLYEIFPEEVKIEPIRVGDFTLVGTLDNFTLKGLLVRGKECLEDRVRFWPQGLIARELGMPLIYLKSGKEGEVDGSLAQYLEYFVRAQKAPSPLVPSFAKALLKGEAADLDRAMKKAEDEIFSYLLLRDPFPEAEVIHRNWSPLLQKVFGGVHAEV